MEYRANFHATYGNARLEEDLRDTNKNRLIDKVRDIAEEYWMRGKETKWWVKDNSGKCVAAGGVDKWWRKRWRAHTAKELSQYDD